MEISNQSFLLNSNSVLELKNKILPYREQEKIKNKWLTNRLNTVLPMLMKREGIDVWVVACKEYNEDPVLMNMVPCSMMTARRTTILVFHLQKDGSVKRMAIARPGIGLDEYYESVWTNPKGSNWDDSKLSSLGKEKTMPESQFECLGRIVRECNALKIGLNYSDNFAFGDGLTHSLYSKIYDCLDTGDKNKIVSAQNLCVSFLETRIEEEIHAYNGIVQIAHSLISEAFSSKVVTCGITTNHDIKYFMIQRVIDLGLTPWFDFEVSIRRKGYGVIYEEATIMPGDILHCDIGLKYMGLCTDTQENAYVLKNNELDVPEDIKSAMKTVNRLQDITIGNFKQGRSGNEILRLSLKQAKEEGIEPCIYTHPIGTHGHGAGPTIGLWDMQNGVKGTGDYLMYNDTCYSLELNCKVTIQSWDDYELTFGAETDVVFTNDEVFYLGGRQQKFHLIK